MKYKNKYDILYINNVINGDGRMFKADIICRNENNLIKKNVSSIDLQDEDCFVCNHSDKKKNLIKIRSKRGLLSYLKKIVPNIKANDNVVICSDCMTKFNNSTEALW